MNRKIQAALTAVSLLVYTTAAADGEDPAVKTAKLTVLTGGEICTVYIDGEEVGDSPVSLLVTPGKHKVNVVADSGEAKEKSVNAKAGQTTVVRFKFPLPEPVKRATAGDFGEESSWGIKHVAVGVAGICVIGGAIVIACNWGSSHGLSSVYVSQANITLSVRTNLTTADGDQIDLVVNGAKILEDYELTTTDRVEGVTLNTGPNVVEIRAENEGTTPPNTGILTISHVTSGRPIQTWSMSAGSTARLIIVAP